MYIPKDCKVIAISGRAGVGKTTLARQLQAEISNSDVFPFAEPIKKFAANLLDIDVNNFRYNKEDIILTSPLFSEMQITKRKLMQKVGDCIKAFIGNDFYDYYSEELLRAYYHRGITTFIIDDMRFEYEFEFVKRIMHEHKKDLLIIGLDNRSLKSSLSDDERKHISEIGIPDADDFLRITKGYNAVYSYQYFLPGDPINMNVFYDIMERFINQ